jgi:hypothetical protein
MTEIFETELGGINAADAVWRCAWKTCDKSFQGRMPPGWERLKPDAARTVADVIVNRSNGALCPKHAAELDGNR